MIKGTLRIIFTGEDLARVRIAGRVDMMWEMALSLHILQRPGGARALSGWRRQARTDLADAGLLKPVRERLVPLVPIKAYFPDFLTPYESMSGFRRAWTSWPTPRRRGCGTRSTGCARTCPCPRRWTTWPAATGAPSAAWPG
ncbi:hypothetical protein ACNF49_29265 [Actinomadura sp. ATCC 39365]